MAECVLRVISFPRKNVFAALMFREASPVVPLWKVADCRRSEGVVGKFRKSWCSLGIRTLKEGECPTLARKQHRKGTSSARRAMEVAVF
jgi:hypothetical protein